MKKLSGIFLVLFLSVVSIRVRAQATARTRVSFNKDWKFYLGAVSGAGEMSFDDENWRNLNLPHDWSIEGKFDKDAPAGTGGGALPGGLGWYRKTFTLPESSKDKIVSIDFDGVYRKSEVWINGHSLGMRPNGYISFRYDLTPYLHFGNEKNILAVKVDNSEQPNSRWYSGSGIYRNVWLVTTEKLCVDHWGTFVYLLKADASQANICVWEKTRNMDVRARQDVTSTTTLYDASGKVVIMGGPSAGKNIGPGATYETWTYMAVKLPHLWSVDDPYLYHAETVIATKGQPVDRYTTYFGIRSFVFDSNKGFLLNGKPLKINGVCDHHDLGCLGTAINKRALERQLGILKAMGCNAIRTSHNPPAPELLDLCDQMGFIVMDEAFDMWKKEKTAFDYHLDWDRWHKKDLEDQILRDRNHPSVFIWSIGNEIPEQWGGDSSGDKIATELRAIVHSLDTTRPITSALNDHNFEKNGILRSGALDLIGYNYEQNVYPDFPKRFPGRKFIGTETVSALETRGFYDMPSDSIRRWPIQWDKPFDGGNAGLECSAYDNVSAPWGSTHEETWKVIKKYDFLSGQFIWTGFDYIGEPTPYPWPARSSYFGIIDLAGFPKDAYYMYQSEWTDKPVLHIFPHWNWKPGQTIDIWAYYSQADEVELLLNGKSLGVKKKQGDDLHVMWRVVYEPGTLSAVSRRNGVTVLTSEIKTAGKPAAIRLQADRNKIKGDGEDLCYVTATIVDAAGIQVPDGGNLIRFTTIGEGAVIGTDNGSETSMESFLATSHRAFNGLCLAVIRSTSKTGTGAGSGPGTGTGTGTGPSPGTIKLTAAADGLPAASINITTE